MIPLNQFRLVAAGDIVLSPRPLDDCYRFRPLLEFAALAAGDVATGRVVFVVPGTGGVHVRYLRGGEPAASWNIS